MLFGDKGLGEGYRGWDELREVENEREGETV